MFPGKIQARTGGDRSLGSQCAGCGSRGQRAGARYCAVCGKRLSEGYQPLDAIRSSYRLQRRALAVPGRSAGESPASLFAAERSGLSDTARACVVYALVPYLGILFVPLGVLIGSVAMAAAWRGSRPRAWRAELLCIGLCLIVMAVQLFLWWLLYIIPEIGI